MKNQAEKRLKRRKKAANPRHQISAAPPAQFARQHFLPL